MYDLIDKEGEHYFAMDYTLNYREHKSHAQSTYIYSAFHTIEVSAPSTSYIINICTTHCPFEKYHVDIYTWLDVFNYLVQMN